MVRGAILGAIAATPLFVLAKYGVFGPLSKSSMDPQITMIIALIAILLVGGLIGSVRFGTDFLIFHT